MTPTPPGWSQDANWFWDGLKWNDAVSPDGKNRYDGRKWRPFHGKRSPMPAEPLHPVAEAPAPAPLSGPPADLPSWVDSSEVERLAKEQRERDEFAAHAALPQIPVPPELDWQRVGEHMKFSHTAKRLESWWQVGAASVVIFLLLYVFCGPAALIFTWLTAWKTDSKIIVTVLVLGLGVLGAFLVLSGTVRRPA